MAKILVVDDEKDFLELVSKMLKNAGYETESALSGKEAFEKLGQNNVDLILLDLMMPEMHGFQVCEELEERPDTRHIPIVVITAKGDLSSIQKAYKCDSVKNYIAKPFEKENLLKTISHVIESKKAGKKEKKALLKIKDYVYREIFENYPEGLVLLNSDNAVVDLNSAFEAMTGLSKKEVLGAKNLPELLRPTDDEGNWVLVSDAFRACFCDDPISTAIFNITNKEGLKLKVVCTIFKTGSKITVIVFRNITQG